MRLSGRGPSGTCRTGARDIPDAGLEDPRAQRAADVVRTDVISVRPDNTLETAAHLMAARGTSHLIVLSPETGFPVGMLSSLDIARAAAA